MEYVSKELSTPSDLTGDNVQEAIEKLIELAIEENVFNPNLGFILECNLSDNETGKLIAFNQKDIYELRLTKHGRPRKWRVIYIPAGHETEYAIGTTAPQP